MTGCIWKLRAFTKKELETVRAAQELLAQCADYWRGGSAQPGGGGGRSQRSQISLPRRLEFKKLGAKTAGFLHFLP
jgi:hypothetical protein